MISDKLDLLREILGDYYREKTDQYLFFCPNPKCEHHKRKLAVNLKLDAFKCWICSYRAPTIYRLVQRYGTYDQRQRWCELTGQIDLSEIDDIHIDPIEEPRIEVRMALPDEFKSLLNIDKSWAARRARQYLYGRGLHDADIAVWKLGYATSGTYEGRIIVPSFNRDGYTNYFVARSFMGHYNKYKNPPAEHDIIFNELYIDWSSDIVLVEGVFDAFVAGTNAIPLLGSYLDEGSRLFTKLVEYAPRVYAALDHDADIKALRMIDALSSYGLEVFKIKIDQDRDVGDMSRDDFRKRKASALAMNSKNRLLYRINRL